MGKYKKKAKFCFYALLLRTGGELPKHEFHTLMKKGGYESFVFLHISLFWFSFISPVAKWPRNKLECPGEDILKLQKGLDSLQPTGNALSLLH